MSETKRTYRTMADKSIGKCESGHLLPLNGPCDLCGATDEEKCRYVTGKHSAADGQTVGRTE